MTTNEEDVPSLFVEGEEEEEEEREVELECISHNPSVYRDQMHMHVHLDAFRQQWKNEIESRQGGREINTETADNRESQARAFFMMGTKLEQEGALYEAVSFYRRAMQLVPDIESKIEFPQRAARDRQESESSIDSFEGEDLEVDLMSRFHNLQVEENQLCSHGYQQRACHISSLPYEVIIYILKWVVTSELDMRSLESVSQVCRGFYLCARDEELWRLSCYRVWGNVTGKVKKYGSWRNMFIERPHLQFVGCYISKMTYQREGERSLDNFYRSWHDIYYFRYVRFFSNGDMLMMTSPEDPSVSLSKLRVPNPPIVGILKGTYRITGNRVSGSLKRESAPDTSTYSKYKRLRNQNNQLELQQTFHVEYEIQNLRKKNGCKLVWLKYSVRTFYRATNESSVSEFDLNNKSYPPLMFSRVKSYSSGDSSPLQMED